MNIAAARAQAKSVDAGYETWCHFLPDNGYQCVAKHRTKPSICGPVVYGSGDDAVDTVEACLDAFFLNHFHVDRSNIG